MKRLLKVLLILSIAVLSLPVAGLLCMRYLVMPSEGYPSWEAVRNYLQRDGEIRITFPDGVQPLSASCEDEEPNSTSIQGNVVVTKIGYSWCLLEVMARTPEGETILYKFHPQKLNNWNRIHYLPENPADPHSPFRKLENGIEKEAHDVSTEAAPQGLTESATFLPSPPSHPHPHPARSSFTPVPPRA